MSRNADASFPLANARITLAGQTVGIESSIFSTWQQHYIQWYVGCRHSVAPNSGRQLLGQIAGLFLLPDRHITAFRVTGSKIKVYRLIL
jgi:hypothetical protein